MQQVKTLPRSLDAIAIGQIVIDHSEWVSLWGYITCRGTRQRMDFILTFDMLNRLLRLSGKAGDRVQMLLVDRLEKGLEEPTVIDLEQHYGRPERFDSCRIEVSKTGIQDKEGRWQDDLSCLSIDEVHPHLESRTPAVTASSLYKHNLSKCEKLLAGSYKLYLGYQELGFDEATALEKSELQDDLKFKMAYYAWSMGEAGGQ